MDGWAEKVTSLAHCRECRPACVTDTVRAVRARAKGVQCKACKGWPSAFDTARVARACHDGSL